MSSARYSCNILIKLDFFSTDFRKIFLISNFMKIRPVGSEVFHADGQGDRLDKANSCFSQCEDAPKTTSQCI